METIIISYLFFTYLFVFGYTVKRNIEMLEYLFIFAFAPLTFIVILGYSLFKLTNK